MLVRWCLTAFMINVEGKTPGLLLTNFLLFAKDVLQQLPRLGSANLTVPSSLNKVVGCVPAARDTSECTAESKHVKLQGQTFSRFKLRDSGSEKWSQVATHLAFRIYVLRYEPQTG